MLEPTLSVIASVAPSFAPMITWLIWLMWSASSCASACAVMVGSTGSWVVESVLAMAHDLSRMDVIVAVSVDRMQERSDSGVAMLLVSSFSIPLPGLPGLYVLLSTHGHGGECCDGIVGVLVAGVVWECEFGDRGLYVVMCGSTSSETGVVVHVAVAKIAKL